MKKTGIFHSAIDQNMPGQVVVNRWFTPEKPWTNTVKRIGEKEETFFTFS